MEERTQEVYQKDAFIHTMGIFETETAALRHAHNISKKFPSTRIIFERLLKYVDNLLDSCNWLTQSGLTANGSQVNFLVQSEMRQELQSFNRYSITSPALYCRWLCILWLNRWDRRFEKGADTDIFDRGRRIHYLENKLPSFTLLPGEVTCDSIVVTIFEAEKY